MTTLMAQIIRSVCMKCKLSSVFDTFQKWGRLPEDELTSMSKKNKTKQKIALAILDLVQKEDLGLTTDIVGGLELSYIQLHSRAKQWKVFKLKGDGLNWHLDPRSLRSRLIRVLQSKWKDGTVFGNVSCHGGAVWLRMHFDQTNKRVRKNSKTSARGYNHNNSVFILHFQGSPYLIISLTRARIADILSQSLVQVFGAENLSYLQLSGRHISSLADIALKRAGKTAVEEYMDQNAKENPLSQSHSDRKKKEMEDILQDMDYIVDENMTEKHVRRMQVEKKFGPDPQPILEKIEYKFNVEFHGRPFTDFNDECKTHVELKGTSVVDGLCQLAKKGFMRFPLPRHVTGVLRNQRNSFSMVTASSNTSQPG